LTQKQRDPILFQNKFNSTQLFFTRIKYKETPWQYQKKVRAFMEKASWIRKMFEQGAKLKKEFR